MKLQWSAHLQQIKMNHITRMLTLSCLEVFTWKAIFTKARQVYSAVVRSEIAFEASVWHQRDKKNKLLSKECRLETLQNQTLHYIAKAFKRVSIETLETETYTSSLHVYLNMLQNKITLHSWVNDQTQEIRQACKLIHAHLMKVNYVISYSLVINFFYFFIKCMQSMTMTLSRRCAYVRLHVPCSKSLLYIFSLINHINSLIINVLKLAYTQKNSNVFAYMLQLIYNIYTYITKARLSFCAHTNRRDAVNWSVFRIFRPIYTQRNHIQSSNNALFTCWAHIWHIHIYCEGTTQLLRTYRQTWCSKSIDFLHFQADLHAAQSHTLRRHNTVFAHIHRTTATSLRTCCN